MGGHILNKFKAMFAVQHKLYQVETHAIPPMDAGLLPNDALDRFQVVPSSLMEIDDIVFDARGYFYISSKNQVFRFRAGNEEDFTVFAEFDGPAGGLNFCLDGKLMVCVAGKGVAFVGDDGALVGTVDMADALPIRCALSAVTGPDGAVYIAEGTIYHEPTDWYVDLMEKRQAGRLIRCDPDTFETEVLLSGLSYPYGVAISRNQKWLLVSESWKHTLSRFPIDNIKENRREIVVPNLPGYPGRITYSSDGGYWMCIFAMRTYLVDFVLTENKYRKMMMRSIDPAYWIRPALFSGEDFLEPLQAAHAITLGILKPWAPPRSYGLVLKMDEDFEVTKSFHCRTGGKRHGISGAAEKEGELYIVSKGNNMVLRSGEEVLK
ncbi:MAG: SMP-30/gluconolactonase/LRE family protein [Deltaproteobacteria bacterium]|nr:SMP-30/gluconolactonase/LRE family protein [Deltaproteobacteria bacterium]